VALIPNAFNNLAKGKEASDKPLQIFKAAEQGLTVPETLITTDPEQATAFFERLGGRVVFKMLRPPRTGRYETRRLSVDDLTDIWRIRSCPVFLQEYVEGAFDLRATVVGERIFCARIDYDADHSLIDTRFTRTGVSIFEVDDGTARALIELTKSLGLVYSSSDLRVTKDGSVVFFELNPDGQYLWTEIETNLPISLEIARRLCGRSN
jgi:glutathione synthase/RimK-type ligase-like ATP-grasp enzyme